MPYIKEKDRTHIIKEIIDLSKAVSHLDKDYKAGNLNFVITKLLMEVYGPIENLKYKDFNEIIGMLESCKLEFYRKMVAPYEDIKERENGKV